MAEPDFFARIWGARGSLPVAANEPSAFGANTACVEIRCGSRVFMLDAGTGSFALGLRLAAGPLREIDVLLSHCHYDHIEGLPFFRPLHTPNWSVRLWAGHMAGRMTAEEILSGYMRLPYFPIGPACFAASTAYRDFAAGDVIDAGGGVTIRTAPLNHPGGCVGFRFEYGGKSICYLTDTEHVPGTPDRNVLSLLRNAGVVIYDAVYTDEEFPRYRGYGHSTWQEGVRLCEAAGAARLVAFHHLPDNDDAALERIESDLRRARPGSVLAREGMVLEPAQ